ncbi:MAG TPA: tetratricopeptide repeat protein, partial [Vicinamibacteria bacterium]
PEPRDEARPDVEGLARRLALPLLLVGLVTRGIFGLAVAPAELRRSLGRATAQAPLRQGRHPPPTLPHAARPPPLPTLATVPSSLPPAGLAPADRERAAALAEGVRARRPMSPGDIADALGLASRYPAETSLQDLAEAVLVSAAEAERAARRYPQAEELLRRALRVKPGSRPAYAGLLNVLLEASDWVGAEAVARELLVGSPDDPAVWRSLGQALMRQDRNREAVEALRTSLALRDDPLARQLLAHVEKGLRDEKGMSEKQLAHFNVRYDGGEHEDVGREILRALDRHHATLTGVFDHRPAAAIPVILFSQQDYYDAAGAPRWSGGVFNHFDGRIRSPIRGLSASLSPDMDNVLVHEVTHAFIADISRGVSPRDVHEGTAQYMEGKRIASVLSGDDLRALADGRIGGVGGFYFGALAFVEYLMGQRGQGGLNDLLRAMGDTGDANAAFRQVYGQDHAATTRAFQERFRRQHGS